MNCRGYRRGQLGIELGFGDITGAGRSHHRDCAACRDWALRQQLIGRSLADIRRVPPPTVNVSARIGEEIRAAANRRTTTAGWSLVALLLAGCGILFGLSNSGIRLQPSLEVAARGAGIARPLIETLWSPLASILKAIGGLCLALLSALANALDSLGSLEPWFVGVTALCTLTMATSVLLVVGRDIGRRRLR